MEFAICQWTPDVSAEAIESLGAEGVTALEPGPSFLDADEAVILSAAQRFRAAGIRLYSVHAPFGGDDDLSRLEEDKRKNAVANHKRALARAALAGIACLVVHPSGRLETTEEEGRRLDRLCASLETLLKTAEKTGVRMALENMLPDHIGQDSATIRRIVDDFDSPYLRVCFDIGHAHLVEEGVITTFGNLVEHIIVFHLQDNDAHQDRHVQPPYGTIDWGAFIREFQRFEFPFPVSVETLPWNKASWSALLREMQALFAGDLVTVPLGDRQFWAVCPECKHYLFGSPLDPCCGCDR